MCVWLRGYEELLVWLRGYEELLVKLPALVYSKASSFCYMRAYLRGSKEAAISFGKVALRQTTDIK